MGAESFLAGETERRTWGS